MKAFHWKKVKVFLLSGIMALATAFCVTLAISIANPVTANAATLGDTDYQTDGASIRVFKRTLAEDGKTSQYEETDKQGIRFHVEMGKGYKVNGTTLVTEKKNEDFNGSFKLADGYKTYTLIIPSHLIADKNSLSLSTDKVMALETTQYWFEDGDGNHESVAYVYNLPKSVYSKNLAFRGIICDSNDNVISQTAVQERILIQVARWAYDDTVKTDSNYWGTETLDNTAAPLIKKFIPTYNITYMDASGDVLSTEEVLWGDAPQNIPSHEGDTWYDTINNEEVDVTKTMDWTANRTLELHTTSSTEFVLTGVAAETDFEVESNKYHGVKVFATLHREAFADKTPMDIDAVNLEHIRGGEVLCDGIELQGVWTLEEQNSLGEWQMLLFFALDTSTLENGDELVIKGDSVFYANNVMYKLTEDYTIDYTEVNNVEDYGMYLGDLYNSDVKEITNCSEDNTGNNGKPNEFTLRVEFYEDVMINGEFTFEFGPESDTSTYPYPVYIRCGEDPTKLIPIAGGRYYWNEGDHKILELIGAGEYANRVFGWHNGDELIGAPGTIVKQNGGYYIFKDEMYCYFLANGNIDKWGYALGDWVVGDELAQYTTSEFAAEGSVAETTDYGTLADEIRINTENHWFGQQKVSILTTEKMSNSAPYAIYCTSEDGTVTEIGKVRYHGQANPDGGNYQILGLCGEGKFTVGDVVTIAAGTRFWLGTEYYTVTEEITYYYNGNFWVQNYDESTMGTLSAANFGDRAHNQGATETRMYFTAPVAGYTTTDGGAFDELRIGTGSITFNGKSLSYVRYQRWDENSTWLSFGGYSGSVAFGDKVVIEAGTTIWGAGSVAYKFTEKVEWIYAANPSDANRTWSRVRDGVTVSATADNATVSGAGTFAVGETYTLKAAPNDGYLISAVIVNSVELPLNAENTYTFTVALHNTIEVETVVGHKVYFTIPDGATVASGAITNGGFKAVAHGGSLTFSVAASEGYKIAGVSNATNNGNGTYTVSNVTADTTVTVSVEKLYKVTYANNTGYTITSTTANGAWVENGTTVTFTVQATSGYIVTAVSGATKSGENTYVATINSADINVTATVVETASIKDITDTIAVENWDGQNDGADFRYFAIKPSTAAEYMIPSTDLQTQSYWNDHPELIPYNYNVDPMAYILINGVSLRQLVTENASTNKYTGTTFPFDHSGVYAPVTLEMGGADSVGLWMKVMTDFATSYEITVAAGFTFAGANDTYYVSEDVTFVYDNGVTGSKYSTITVTTSNATVGGITNGQQIEFGKEYTATFAAKDGYQITSVVVDGTDITGQSPYTFTANGQDVSIEVTAKKLYAVTWSNPDGATITVTANDKAIDSGATVVEGTSISVTVTASSGYTVTNVTANGTSIGTTSGTYTVNGATTIAATAKKTYAVTWSNPKDTSGNTMATITVNGDSSGSLSVVEGTSISVTVTASGGYRLDTVTIGGKSQSGVNTNQAGSSTFNYTVNNTTTISATTVKMYTVTATFSNATVILGDTTSMTSETAVWVDKGTYLLTVSPSDGYTIESVTGTGVSGNNSPYTVDATNENVNIIIKTKQEEGGTCLAAGAMITLSDGTKRAVENLRKGDSVMAFDHLTGKVVYSNVIIVVKTASCYYKNTFIFDDGTQLATINEHGIFDLNLNKYVNIDQDNYKTYLGHDFVSIDVNGNIGTKKLINVVSVFESGYKYDIVTNQTLNYVAEDTLSVTHVLVDVINTFDFGEDLIYDQEKMQADIETYGLYTYDEWEEYCDISVFEQYNIPVMKVGISKGLYTKEYIIGLINKYVLDENVQIV